MIKLTPKVRDGQQIGFEVHADEPVTVTVLENNDGFGHVRVLAHIYRGYSVDEHSEPVGAYDGWLPKNEEWTTAKPKRSRPMRITKTTTEVYE